MVPREFDCSARWISLDDALLSIFWYFSMSVFLRWLVMLYTTLFTKYIFAVNILQLLYYIFRLAGNFTSIITTETFSCECNFKISKHGQHVKVFYDKLSNCFRTTVYQMIPRSLESQNFCQHIKTHKIVRKWSTSVEKKRKKKKRQNRRSDR